MLFSAIIICCLLSTNFDISFCMILRKSNHFLASFQMMALLFVKNRLNASLAKTSQLHCIALEFYSNPQLMIAAIYNLLPKDGSLLELDYSNLIHSFSNFIIACNFNKHDFWFSHHSNQSGFQVRR